MLHIHASTEHLKKISVWVTSLHFKKHISKSDCIFLSNIELLIKLMKETRMTTSMNGEAVLKNKRSKKE